MFPAEIDFLQLGVAGGALAVLIVLGRGFFKQNRDLMKHQEETQDQVLQFFGNHMSEIVDSQERTARVLESLVTEIKSLRYELRVSGHVDSRVNTE